MKNRKYYILVIFNILISVSVSCFSQAGSGLYKFLDFSPSARTTALGGMNVSLIDNDITMLFSNPALLTEKTHNMLSLNYANFPAFMNGTASYGYNLDARNYFGLGVQYDDYGTLIGKNEYNQDIGNFYVKDIALYLSYGRKLSESLTVGLSVKPIFLTAEQRTSFGLGVDVGMSYQSSGKDFSAGLVFKNIGTQLKGFYSEQTGQFTEPLPFNIEAGFSWKLLHAPLRFSFTLHDLNRWDLSYEIDNTRTKENLKKINFFDMAFRHTIIGIEFIPSNNFYVDLGYNHRRSAELSTTNFKSLAGFSIGAGVKISKFHFAFAMAQYQSGLNIYHFTLATSLEDFGL
ncbi:MAG: type IX secretion system protein PorQ [Paludibacter sp.]|nr:type IX secretion system protein PorQ [Paludibacter sp.]